MSLVVLLAAGPTAYRPTVHHRPQLRTSASSPTCIALDPKLDCSDAITESKIVLPDHTHLLPDLDLLVVQDGEPSDVVQSLMAPPPVSDFIVDFPAGTPEPVETLQEFVVDFQVATAAEPEPSPTDVTDFMAEFPVSTELEAEAAKLEKAKQGALPSLGELARFCLPTLGIWLAPPFLSLIDTSVVGMHCATSSLAALAPSTKLCDYLSYMCTALGAADLPLLFPHPSPPLSYLLAIVNGHA